MSSEARLVHAAPTKRFFVSMLTRDIELKDAILDLLDNCVDGIQRQLRHADLGGKAYTGYWAKITATPNQFSIEDNCGGIPLKVAEESAFMLGRNAGTKPDEDLHTVGMYGIGMKRAIFKIGRDAVVFSNPKNEDSAFEVAISPSWMESDEWDLPLKLIGKPSGEFGTKITIKELNDTISRSFDSTQSSFLSELAISISQFYAIIMGKGFRVFLNDVEISPASLMVLYSGQENAVDPYVFTATVNDVSIEMAIGFKRPLASQQEQDEEADQPRSSNEAGWTVICNDRVVLYNDRSQLTGWGRGTVPRYHTQFIAIGGIVEFRSQNLYGLPLTTTKRGLNTDNEAYLTALDYMMEGLKKFTDFTNKWKGRESETNQVFRESKHVSFATASKNLLDSEKATSVRKIDGAKRVIPNLLLPTDKNPNRKIVYTKTIDQIEQLAHYFFDGTEDIQPSDVGSRSFDECLKKALSERGHA